MKKILLALLTAFLVIGMAAGADDPATIAPPGEAGGNEVTIESGGSWTAKETITDATGMGEYLWYGEGFCWTHTWANASDPGVYIMDSWLVIRAWDVDSADGEVDEIYADGVYLGNLEGVNGEWSLTQFTVPSSLVEDGEVEVCIVIDATDDAWAVEVAKSMLFVKFDYGMSTPEPAIAVALVALTVPGMMYLIRKRT